jgi:hypothetical protein
MILIKKGVNIYEYRIARTTAPRQSAVVSVSNVSSVLMVDLMRNGIGPPAQESTMTKDASLS